MKKTKGENIQCQHGLILLVLLFLVFLGYDIGRHFLVNQEVPTFFVEEPSGMQIAIEEEGGGSKTFQIYDGLSPGSVINLTNADEASFLSENIDKCEPLISGEIYTLQVVRGDYVNCTRRWMPAAQRVVLGIPLHPDRMTRADWEYLPGVGSHLASAIENNRQINGDFVELGSLLRVKGVGEKRVESWREFF